MAEIARESGNIRLELQSANWQNLHNEYRSKKGDGITDKAPTAKRFHGFMEKITIKDSCEESNERKSRWMWTGLQVSTIYLRGLNAPDSIIHQWMPDLTRYKHSIVSWHLFFCPSFLETSVRRDCVAINLENVVNIGECALSNVRLISCFTQSNKMFHFSWKRSKQNWTTHSSCWWWLQSYQFKINEDLERAVTEDFVFTIIWETTVTNTSPPTSWFLE